jgi:hypothetical protein
MDTNKELKKRIRFYGNWYGKNNFSDEEADHMAFGKFRMNVSLGSDGNFTGLLNDEHGLSKVVGNLSKYDLTFMKKYILGKSSEIVKKTPIVCGASLFRSGNFIGFWNPKNIGDVYREDMFSVSIKN